MDKNSKNVFGIFVGILLAIIAMQVIVRFVNLSQTVELLTTFGLIVLFSAITISIVNVLIKTRPVPRTPFPAQPEQPQPQNIQQQAQPQQVPEQQPPQQTPGSQPVAQPAQQQQPVPVTTPPAQGQ